MKHNNNILNTMPWMVSASRVHIIYKLVTDAKNDTSLEDAWDNEQWQLLSRLSNSWVYILQTQQGIVCLVLPLALNTAGSMFSGFQSVHLAAASTPLKILSLLSALADLLQTRSCWTGHESNWMWKPDQKARSAASGSRMCNCTAANTVLGFY